MSNSKRSDESGSGLEHGALGRGEPRDAEDREAQGLRVTLTIRDMNTLLKYAGKKRTGRRRQEGMVRPDHCGGEDRESTRELLFSKSHHFEVHLAKPRGWMRWDRVRAGGKRQPRT